jgi:hypothetical protein
MYRCIYLCRKTEKTHMTQTKINPLTQFSKKPARYIRIPSQGIGYTKGITLTDSGELAVYPMTAKDELMLKSPDALLNGQAVMGVLANCVPDIVDPTETSVIDLDAIMVAIRMATYGDNMDMEITCPHDQHENTVGVQLPMLLDQQTYWTGLTEVELESGVKAKLKPYTIRDHNRMSLNSFDQMTKLNQLDKDDNDTATKLMAANVSFSSLVDVSLDIVARSVEVAITPDGQEITDFEFIKEWIRSLSKSEFEIIDKALKDLVKIGLPKSMNIKCDKCSEVFEAPINFNPSDFFG